MAVQLARGHPGWTGAASNEGYETDYLITSTVMRRTFAVSFNILGEWMKVGAELHSYIFIRW